MFQKDWKKFRDLLKQIKEPKRANVNKAFSEYGTDAVLMSKIEPARSLAYCTCSFWVVFSLAGSVANAIEIIPVVRQQEQALEHTEHSLANIFTLRE